MAKELNLKYKIRAIVEIEGSSSIPTGGLRDNQGFEPYLQWALEDIEEQLSCACDIVRVTKVELEEVDEE